MWYSLGVLSCQNLILAPSTEGSAAIPYSIHQDGTKMMSGNSRMIFRFDLKPDFRIEIIVQVLDSEVAGNPRAVDDQRHRNLVQLLAARGSFKHFPLFRQHGLLSSVTPGRCRNTRLNRPPACHLLWTAQIIALSGPGRTRRPVVLETSTPSLD